MSYDQYLYKPEQVDEVFQANSKFEAQSIITRQQTKMARMLIQEFTKMNALNTFDANIKNLESVIARSTNALPQNGYKENGNVLKNELQRVTEEQTRFLNNFSSSGKGRAQAEYEARKLQQAQAKPVAAVKKANKVANKKELRSQVKIVEKRPEGGVRHRHLAKRSREYLSDSQFMRLGRRAGITMFSRDSFPVIRDYTVQSMREILNTAFIFTKHAHRRTIQSEDIIAAAKQKKYIKGYYA